MICAWMETSRADTGSSQMIILGRIIERAGDADPLPLSAGELVRVAVDVLGAETHGLEHHLAALLPLLARAHAVDDQRLGHDLAEGHARD